ncbi:MAG: ABC transporter ATP-binding protein [Ruminococcaceae bacterium]|nr:ABC transporter ATP-binding protein [Oscillospiraceae bacterium]
MSILTCRNICKSYGNNNVLDNVSFEIERGRIVGLLGRNGAGKTTVIKLINDLLTANKGEIHIDGQGIGVYSKSRISYLPERTYLDKQMKVGEALNFFEDFYGDFNTEKAKQLLKDLQLDENQQIVKMSKGMQEKLQLVLVMSRKADLYILDEPFGGVDPATRDYILDTILSNFDENSSILISTHLIADVERILDDVVFIDGGNIVLSGAADEIRDGKNASIDEIFRRMFKC